MHPIFAVLISYLIGSISFAYIIGRARGVDLRKHGSGNLGASNAVRVLGWRLGGLVYVGDTLKGFLPVTVLPRLVNATNLEWWTVAFGIATVVGHIFPIFLLGKGGGKGVATGGGVFLGLAWLPTVIAALVFVVVLSITRISSISSLSAATVLPIGVGFWAGWRSPIFLLSVVVYGLVIWTHRANIGRLRRGEELRVGPKTEPSP